MITSWCPASLTVGARSSHCTHNVEPQSMSTSAKVCQVSKFLCTLLWASLMYGARGQLTGPFPAQFELSSLDGSNGFSFIGDADEASGISVSSAGDVNGDGLSDIVIGASKASPLGKMQAGKSYVVFGTSNLINGGKLDFSNLDGRNGFVINGEAEGDHSGFSVSSGGDINGDKLSDILIGAYLSKAFGGNSAIGRSYVVFGSRNFSSIVGNSGSIELSSLDGKNGFIINGDESRSQSGISVSLGGDVDGDGFSDLLIGAHQHNPSGRLQAGRTFVIYGSRTIGISGQVPIESTNGFRISGERQGDKSGRFVSFAGDVDGDGYDDIVIGAPDANFAGKQDAGKVYVVFGSHKNNQGSKIDFSIFSGSNVISIRGEAADDRCGHSVTSAGDVNGDGLSDIVIGAPLSATSGNKMSGRSYVVYGTRTRINGGVLELSSLNGTNGYKLDGEFEGDESGYSVSSGDINGDGLSDIVIGASYASPTGRSRAGRSYVVFGSRVHNFEEVLNLSNLNGTNGFIINGEASNDESGCSLSSSGDFNGDGINDLVIGARHANATGRFKAGKSYVVFGRNYTSSIKSPSPIKDTLSSLKPTASSKLSPSQPLKSIVSFSQKASLLFTSETLQFTHSIGLKSAQPSPESDSSPIIAGLAAAVGALACSLFAGALFFWRKQTSDKVDRDKSDLKNIESTHIYDAIDLSQKIQKAGDDEMQSARYDQLQSKAQNHGNYTSVPSTKLHGNYKEWPQKQALSDPKQYTSIDKVEKQHDAYVAAKFEKAHENYDDLPT